MIHGALASDSYYAQSSGAGDTGIYATPSPSPSVSSPSPSTLPPPASTYASGQPAQTPQPTYAAPTPQTLARADYTAPSDLGDTKTQQIMKDTGASVEQALQIQYEQAKDTRAKSYYENELRKSLQSNISVSGEYHYRAMKSGLPVAANPFENAADLSLKAVGDGSFKVGFMKAPDIEAVAQAKATGDMGAYGKLGSYSSTYGQLSVADQQAIAKQVAKSRPDYAIDESQLSLLPQTKDFGYGGQTYVPSETIKEKMQKATEQTSGTLTLPSLGAGKANESPIFVNATEPSKFVLKDNVMLGTAGTVAMADTLTKQENDIKNMTAGKLNAQGQFTGTAEEFAKLSALQTAYQTTLGNYKTAYEIDYNNYLAEAKKPKLYFTPLSKEDVFGAPQKPKNLIEQGMENIGKNYDMLGGFVRQVGSITETPWTPNVIDVVAETGRAIGKYSDIKTGNEQFDAMTKGARDVGVAGLTFLNPVLMSTMREGAQERPSEGAYATSDTLKYGEYTKASDEFSFRVLQPLVGSPAKFEAHSKYWEGEFNKPDATIGDKLVSGSMLIGAEANKYVVKNPGDIPVIATQAAAIEATGLFEGIGSAIKFGGTKVGELTGMTRMVQGAEGVATPAHPLLNTIATGTTKLFSKYGVDIGFATLIAGEATKTDEGWFKQTEPTKILKNLGPLGAQLVVFTAGTYGVGLSKPSIPDVPGTDPFTLKTERTISGGGPGTGKWDTGGGSSGSYDWFFRRKTPSGGGQPPGGSAGTGRSYASGGEGGGGSFSDKLMADMGKDAFGNKKTRLDLMVDEANAMRTRGDTQGYESAMNQVRVLEKRLINQKAALGEAYIPKYQSPVSYQAPPMPKPAPTYTAPDLTKPMSGSFAGSGGVSSTAKSPFTTGTGAPLVDFPKPEFKTNMAGGNVKGNPITEPFGTEIKSGYGYVKYSSNTGVEGIMTRGQMISIGESFPPRNTLTWLEKYYEKSGSQMPRNYYDAVQGYDVTLWQNKPRGELVKYKKPDLAVELWKPKEKGIVEYKAKPKGIVEYRKPKTDITKYSAPKIDVVEFKAKPTDIVPFREKPKDIVPFEKKPSDIVPTKPKDMEPWTKKEIIPVEVPGRPFKEGKPREPVEEKVPPEKGGGGFIPPFVIPDLFGSGGGSQGGGGSGGGGRKGMTDVFKYGFGIKDIAGFKVPKGGLKMFPPAPKPKSNVVRISVKSLTPQKVSVSKKRKK